MVPSLKGQPHKIDLVKSAERCEEHLNRLKKHASDLSSEYTSGKKHALLSDVVMRSNDCIKSLKAWAAALGNGRQTSDEGIRASLDEILENIVLLVADAQKALDHRLSLTAWASEKTKKSDLELLDKKLNEITETIGYLHNQVKTVLRDTPEQKERKKRILEIARKKSKFNGGFTESIRQMPEVERQTLCFGTCRILWEEFPQRLELEDVVGNIDNPGDGIIYDEESIGEVTQILKTFHQAWLDATVNIDGATPASQHTLDKVAKLPEMARICLILHGMKQERLLDRFCERAIYDNHLPLLLETLRSALEEEDHIYAEAFCTEQYRAMRRTWPEGTHINVARAEPLPLISTQSFGAGSFGSVTRVLDVYTKVLYARKEQMSFDARDHLRREIASLKRLGHRHIVQFVKSYERGDRYGILLKPAATTDLKKLLDRYRRNGLDYDRDARDRRRDRAVLKPVLLTAFGCLTRGLAHIHGCNVRHKDIKPANILYEKAKDPHPARFLWADFGLAHDFGDKDTSKTVSKNRHRYSPRYAAPEIMEQYEARKAQGEIIYDETDDEDNEDDDEVKKGGPPHAPDQLPNGSQSKFIGDGRSSDIYSFGIVFLEILSYLVAEDTSPTVPPNFEDCMPFWKNIDRLQGWARKQIQRLLPDDPLVFLFKQSSQMIAHNATARPIISDIVTNLENADANSQYFCSACRQDPTETVSQLPFPESYEYSSAYNPVSINEVNDTQEIPDKQLEVTPLDHANAIISSDPLDQTLEPEAQLNMSAEAGTSARKQDIDEAIADAEDERDDDLASLASLPSLPDSGYESLKDNHELIDEADELCSMLLEDVQLHELFTVAFKRAKAREKFIVKFRMLLQLFGSELKKEAKNDLHKAAAGLAQTKATYVANKVQTWYTLEDEHKEKSNDDRSARVEILLLNRLEPTQLVPSPAFPDQYENESDSDHSVDINLDAEVLAENETKPQISLRELKGFIVSSSAFNHLQNAFRRMVYPDPFKAVSETISEAYDPEQGQITAVFNVRWEIVQYLKSELGYHPALLQRSNLLNSALTVTGTVSKAYANTAAEYMRWKWPTSNLKLLENLEGLLKGRRTTETGERSNLSIKLHNSYRSAGPTISSISVKGFLHDLIEVAQQLVWITASFRIPRYGQLSYSEVVLERTGDMIFNISLLELEAVRQRANACWLPLFENGIVARGFPIPARSNEKGIELPFSVMTGLANIMYPVSYIEGVYLRGFSKLLFPTAASPDMKSVQWHSMSSPNPRMRIAPGTLPNEDGEFQWLKFVDFDRLAFAGRTFLGYCRAVNVHLGTESSKTSFENVTYSGADDEHPAPKLAPKSMTTGTSGLGIWGFSINADIVMPKGLLANTESGGYLHQIDLAREMPVILYDNAKASKRAWLVPTLSVILHMAHIWARDKDDLLTTLPFASLEGDPGRTASMAIKKHSRVELRDELKGDEKYHLSDLIGRLLISFDKLADAEAKAKSEPGRGINLETSKLYGWDLLAVAKGQKIINRKQVDLDQDWMKLGADVLVLFCQGLGDVIRPTSDVSLCPWGDLSRHGRNYLTATVQCLKTLSERRTGSLDNNCLRLADKVYWPCPEDKQFENCAQCLTPSSERHIRCVKRPQQMFTSRTSGRNPGSLPSQGAVSFGSRKLRKAVPMATSERVQLLLTASETHLDHENPQSDSRPRRASDIPLIELENTAFDEASASPPERTLNSSATSETQDVRSDTSDALVTSFNNYPETPLSYPSTQDTREVVDKGENLQVIRTKARKFPRLPWKLLKSKYKKQ